jgi:hypothetical protein
MDIIIGTICYQSPIHGMKFCSKLFILLRNEKREELTNLDYEYSGHFDLTA